MTCKCVCATAAVSADTRTRPVFIAQRHMSKLNYHPDNKLYILLCTTVGLVLLSVVYSYIYIYYIIKAFRTKRT